MGMFDNVECEFLLPGSLEGREWQTKSFAEPFLRKHRITVNGRLLRELVHYEDRSAPNAVGLAKLAGMMTPVHDGWEDLNYHGVVNFYGTAGAEPEFDWHEYNATFEHGQLVRIEPVVEPAT